jgi:hypothetical protein
MPGVFTILMCALRGEKVCVGFQFSSPFGNSSLNKDAYTRQFLRGRMEKLPVFIVKENRLQPSTPGL